MENQRIRLSKQLLKDSLVKLLHEKSIHKISVREICDFAQVNRTTFYKYYGSPYDLLEGIEGELLSQIDGYLGSVSEHSDEERLQKVLSYAINNIDLCRLLLNNNVDPDFPGRLLGLPHVQVMLGQRLNDGFEGVKLKYLSEFIVTGGFSVIRQWINEEHPESPDVMASLVFGFTAKLIRPDDGPSA